jgi:hypothetical protein
MSFLGRLTCFAKLESKPWGKKYGTDDEERTWSDDLSECNLVSSKVDPELFGLGMHMPALDIDFQAHLLPSSTSGHFHLYLDKPMTWNNYLYLLKALAAVGILESGFLAAARRREATYLRLPHIPKQSPVQPRRMRVPRPPGKEQS